MDKKRLNIVQRILDYLGDKLSNKDRYAFEQDFSQDPFLQDAMDGFMELSADDFEKDIQQLTEKLQTRTEQKKVRKLIPFMRIAAGITILVGIGAVIALLFNNNLYDSKLAEQSQIEVAEKEDIEEAPSIILEETPKQINEEIEKPKKKELKPEALQTTKPLKKSIATQSEKTKNNEESRDKGFIEEEIVIKEEYLEEEKPLADDENLAHTIEPQSIAPPEKAQKKQRATVSAFSSQTASSAPVTDIKTSKNKISGVIVDENNKPLPGVNVLVSGTTKGAVTDLDGRFAINADTNASLDIRFIGYTEEKISVNDLQAQSNTIDLEPDLLALEEVVVVGYGTQKKSNLTGAVTTISNEELTGVPPADRNIIYKARAVKIKYEINCDKQAVPVVDIKQYKKYIKKQFELTINKPAKIEVIFTINSKGDITDYATIESPNVQFTNRAEYLIKNGKKWKAAIMNGEPVSQKVTLIIKF